MHCCWPSPAIWPRAESDIAGLLQRRSDANATVEFALMPDTFRAVACGTALPQAAAALRAAIEQGPDLLVINRFGSAELSGGGLLGVLIEAAQRDIPVLIARARGAVPGLARLHRRPHRPPRLPPRRARALVAFAGGGTILPPAGRDGVRAVQMTCPCC
ncbi:MAG: DUF2478 domain-containing protein [Aliidongia sp.]